MEMVEAIIDNNNSFNTNDNDNNYNKNRSSDVNFDEMPQRHKNISVKHEQSSPGPWMTEQKSTRRRSRRRMKKVSAHQLGECEQF
jgi:hypothetical protein